MWYVYILRCADGKNYTGCTSDLKKRFWRHNGGGVPSTKDRRPIALICYIAFNDKKKAYDFERYLKGGSGRAFLNKRFV